PGQDYGMFQWLLHVNRPHDFHARVVFQQNRDSIYDIFVKPAIEINYLTKPAAEDLGVRIVFFAARQPVADGVKDTTSAGKPSQHDICLFFPDMRKRRSESLEDTIYRPNETIRSFTLLRDQ